MTEGFIDPNLAVQNINFDTKTINRIITPARCLIYGPRYFSIVLFIKI